MEQQLRLAISTRENGRYSSHKIDTCCRGSNTICYNKVSKKTQ